MELEAYFKKFYGGTKNPSLAVMEYFMKEYGRPQKELNVIHIAGTNGKGSVTEILANILIKSGYKTGKFMSPHLISYQERININYQNISEKELENLILELNPKIEDYNNKHETQVTLFELETIMAILYFARNNCDFVIMETGLGGLYDCTNIVTSNISILTSIGYDHMNILGKTLPEIAFQKAGIIKANSDTIFIKQEPEVNAVIEKKCQETHTQLHEIDIADITQVFYDKELTRFDYQHYKTIETPLKGPKQPQNTAICLECIEVLKEKGYLFEEKVVKEAIKTVVHKGRFETIAQKPLMIFDGAHNEPAIEHLKDTIELYFAKEKKVFIVSIFNTKDYPKILEQILAEDAIFIFTDGNDEGGFVPKEELYRVASKITDNTQLYQLKMAEAIRFVKEKYRNYVTFIIGSFYVYGTVMKELEEEKNDTN